MAVSAQCHRVNVADGHMAAVRVKFSRAARARGSTRGVNIFSFVAAGAWVIFCAGNADRRA